MDELTRRKIIETYINEHPESSLYKCTQFLKEPKISPRTVYRVGKDLRSEGSVDRKPGTGRKTEKMDAAKVRRFLELAKGWSKSAKCLASKFNISRQYAQKIMKKHGIKCYKKQKVEIDP